MGSIRHLPDLARAAAGCRRMDVRSAQKVLATQRSAPWEARYLYTLALGGNRKLEEFLSALDEWCWADPLSADPWLLRGLARTQWAWEARTSQRAEAVTQEGWRIFRERLGLAHSDLQWAAELLPRDPVPWVGMISVQMGGGHGSEPILELFREATERDPYSFAAHSTALHALTKKWHGDHEQMLEFARAGAAQAAFDNDLAALVVEAHSAFYLYLLQFDKDRAAADAYLENRLHQREVGHLFDRTFAAPDYRERVASYLAWNEFALWFYWTRDRRRLQTCLRLLRGRYSLVWKDTYDDGLKTLRKVERFAADV